MGAGRRTAARSLTDPMPADVRSNRAWRMLCRLEDLTDGHSRGFDPLDEGRDTMFLVRKGGRVYGYRNACPHVDYARMAWRKDAYLNGDRSRIMCSAHGALFRIEDGRCETGPCVGAALEAVDLTMRDGEVWLAGSYAPGRRPGRAVGGGRLSDEMDP